MNLKFKFNELDEKPKHYLSKRSPRNSPRAQNPKSQARKDPQREHRALHEQKNPKTLQIPGRVRKIK